jgi:hypothetical protein
MSSFEIEPTQVSPVIDPRQIFGARMLQAALGLEAGQLKSMMVFKDLTGLDVAIGPAASNLIASIRAEFNLNGANPPLLKIEDEE